MFEQFNPNLIKAKMRRAKTALLSGGKIPIPPSRGMMIDMRNLS